MAKKKSSSKKDKAASSENAETAETAETGAEKRATADEAEAALPLVAILRGVEPGEVEQIGEALIECGFRTIEVPLNSPDPFDSIERLVRRFGEDAVIGAGTVLHVDDVHRVAEAGGRLIVMPHSDPAVIGAARQQGLACMPGVATPSEAFAALAAGANALKAFPAEMITPAVVKAWLAVLPDGTGIFPVGGIKPSSMAAYLKAGARGFGLGSALYKPGQTAAKTATAAKKFVTAWEAANA